MSRITRALRNERQVHYDGAAVRGGEKKAATRVESRTCRWGPNLVLITFATTRDDGPTTEKRP